jgi:hypothetical protein
MERLLTALGNDVLSSKDIMARLKLKARVNFAQYYLRPALDAGIIEMTIPDKPKSGRQKYRAKRCQ